MLKSLQNTGKYLIHLICFVLKVANGATIFSTSSDHISNTQYLKYNLHGTQRYSQSCIIRNQTHIDSSRKGKKPEFTCDKCYANVIHQNV